MRRQLLVSHLILIGITLALLSFTAFRATARSFERFSAAHTAVHTGVLIGTLENYYAQHNSWAGVQNQVVSLSLVSGFLVTVRDNRGTVVGSTLSEALPTAEEALLQLNLTAAGQPIGTAYIDRSVELAAVDNSFSADPLQIGQMLFNLVENAIRHTPPQGKVTVRAAVATQQLHLTVQDNGEGIAAVHLPHIFERFYRADSARPESGAGSGLGLAIVKGIVQAHDGEITVQSTVDTGSCFTISLPLSVR